MKFAKEGFIIGWMVQHLAFAVESSISLRYARCN